MRHLCFFVLCGMCVSFGRECWRAWGRVLVRVVLIGVGIVGFYWCVFCCVLLFACLLWWCVAFVILFVFVVLCLGVFLCFVGFFFFVFFMLLVLFCVGVLLFYVCVCCFYVLVFFCLSGNTTALSSLTKESKQIALRISQVQKSI